MSEQYWGAGSPFYKNTRIACTGSEISVRAVTSPVAGSRAFAVSATDGTIVTMRSVIIRNFGANDLTVKIVTNAPTQTAYVETPTGTADPITIPAGESIDTYGRVDNITDVLATGTNLEQFEIFQHVRDETGG